MENLWKLKVMIILVFFPFVILAQEDRTEKVYLNDILIKLNTYNDHISTFKKAKIFDPDVETIIDPNFFQSKLYNVGSYFKMLNLVEEQNPVGVDLMCIKTDVNYKPQENKLILYIFNNDKSFYMADTLVYQYSKSKNTLHYYKPQALVPLPQDTLNVTFGFYFHAELVTPFRLKNNEIIPSYLHRFINDRIETDDVEKRNHGGGTPQMQIFFSKVS